MKILLTGGAGYIGSHTALSLIDAGHELHIIDNLSTGDIRLIPKKAHFTECNINNEKIVSNKKQFTKFDEDLEKFTNQIIKKFDEDLNRFGFNVVIASIYKIYSFYSKQINKEDWGSNFYKNYTNILEIINPIVPHFSNECLEKLNHSIKNIKWPSTNKKYLKEDTFQIVTQVNGKKRKVFSIDR